MRQPRFTYSFVQLDPLRSIAAGLLLLLFCQASFAAVSLTPAFGDMRFNQPIFVQQMPGSDAIWYVIEKAGRILRVEKHGDEFKQLLFADLSDRIDSSSFEGGLLGIALHPGFPDIPAVFLSYTTTGHPLFSDIVRYRSDVYGRRLFPHSGEIVLRVDQPFGNHNGGHVVFGPDGMLYVGLGDGGDAGDPYRNGQNPDTLLGTILRIDINRQPPYAIPRDNPFVKGGGRPEVFAFGLRNPWRFSFDRDNGELWAGDVGQNRWEEIDRIVAGGNYGWNRLEGDYCYNAAECDRSGVIMPEVSYSHGEGCSVTGGYVYRGKRIAELQGRYLFGDFCSGVIWSVDAARPRDKRQLLASDVKVAAFAEENDGELLLIDLGGQVLRFVPR